MKTEVWYYYKQDMDWQRQCRVAARKARNEEFANYCERDLQNAQTHQDQDDEWIERENS